MPSAAWDATPSLLSWAALRGQLQLTPVSSFLPGGLSLWLVVWLVLGKPNPASACPHRCVCYPTPMTVSCQAQNFTTVPVGVPYESQRVFLQNNRITELRVGSFGFGTQVSEVNGALQCVRIENMQIVFTYYGLFINSLLVFSGSVAFLQQHHMDWGRGF